MAKKATAHDAQLILKLYDLRREAEMRKARHWFVVEFWPQSADDFLKVVNAFPSQENTWLRQVGSYWDMAASLVLQGALHEELFVQPGCSGEMFFIFAKIHPFLKEMRAEDEQSRRLVEHRESGDRIESRRASDWSASRRMLRIAAKRWPSPRRRADLARVPASFGSFGDSGHSSAAAHLLS